MTSTPSNHAADRLVITKTIVWPRVRQWAVATAILVPVMAWMSRVGGQSLPSVIRSLPQGLVLAAAIGSFAWVLIPAAARITARWHPTLRWALYVPAMIFCAVAGTALTWIVPFLVGVLDARDIIVVFRQNIAGTIPVTIIIGSALILIATAKARLEASELSLKTQQLERERAEKLAAEAQLASLTSRVQPHFLFNTLNSISGLIREQPAQAERMIEHLSSLLRSSLDGKEVVPIAQEIRLVTDYLEIQRTRLGGRLRYDLVVSADAAGDVPPFLLQTLVENSLKHVGGRRPESLTLRIDVRREDRRLVLTVTDDGPGFDPDAMKAGHGLDILERRLRAVFGDAAAMTFDRQPGSMTVRLRVPVT
jgi:two-component system, LytTR family, sensor histidine kinase AlgZ